uniref:Uncharacterized protein n=1 Tax=Arundo donax TaxID=35708 RepID=A0A0A8YA77_ARUDO
MKTLGNYFYLLSSWVVGDGRDVLSVPSFEISRGQRVVLGSEVLAFICQRRRL